MSFNNYDTYGGTTGATDERFMSPVTPSGQVLFNGAIADGAVIAAFQNKSPKYPLPKGAFAEYVGLVRVADIVYCFIDANQYVQASYERYANATTVGLSSINGQGDINETEESFMSRIQVLGLAFMETDVNKSKLFNIHCGGLYTVMNLSNVDIVAGNWLIVYAPTPAEAAEGGRGEEPDMNGVMTLWFKPYHPEIHRFTSRQIFACLTQRTQGPDVHTTMDGKLYLPEYEQTCDHLFDSFLSIGIVVTEFLRQANVIQLAGAGSAEDTYIKFMAAVGHTRFYNTRNTNALLRQELLNALFLSVVRRNSDEYETANLFPNEKRLRDCQMEATDVALVSMARFIHTITKNIIGKAITSMGPKKNGQMQLCSYIGGK